MRNTLLLAANVAASFVLSFVAAAGDASAQTISYANLGTEVGAGLQIGTARARLSDSTHGGISVHIESSDSLVALVSPNNSLAGTPGIDVFVPNGQTDALFWVQGLEDITGTVDIIASAPGYAPDTSAVQVLQPAVEISSLATSIDAFGNTDPFQIRVGLPSGAGVNPNQQVRAGSDGLVVTITNSIAGVGEIATLPDTGQTVILTIDPGLYYTPGSLPAGGAGFDPIAVGMTTVSATIPGFIATDNASREVTVTQPYINVGAVSDVGAGLRTSGQAVWLSGPQHGGVTLHIACSDTNLALISGDPDTLGRDVLDIFIPNGSGTSATYYYVQGKEDTTGTVSITGTAPGFTSDQETGSVVTPGISLYSLDTTIDVLDPLKSVRARVGIPNGSLTGINPAQYRRPGAPPLVVTVTSSDPAVANFQTLTDTSGVVTTEIAPGSSTNPANVATGGVDMDGLSAGTTTVTVSSPGFLNSGGTKVVTVSQPTINLNTIEDVGAGLRTGVEYVYLSASQHGGVTMTLTSLDPDLALLSPALNGAVGDTTISLIFNPGQTYRTFYVHGLEDTTGTATIVASEPMFFLPDTSTVSVVTPGISILSLASTFDTLDPTEDFAVRVGVPHSSLGYVLDAQGPRPGGGGVLATVSSSDPAVAQILTLADTSGTVTLLVDEEDNTTPSTVASGGVGADGLSPGTTFISVSADGFISTDQAIHEVTVTAPTMTLSVTDVGSGLQEGLRHGQLSASGHPGVTVHIASLDSSLSLVSTGEATAGGASIDVFVPAGQTSFGYVLQALEDTTGSSGIAVSAPFFAPDTAYFDVIEPGVKFTGLGSTIDVADPGDSFYAILGKPSTGNTDIGSSNEQAARVGGGGVTVTFVTADSTLSRLVGTSTSGGTVSLVIPPSASRTPTTLGAGGVAFDGLAEGSSVVSVSAPGFISVSTAFKTVFITDDNLYLLGLPLDVGAGLQTGALTAQLGKSGHGGVTLRIESSDSTLVRLSAVSGVAGDPFVETSVPNGETEVNYFIHGQAGTTGEALITATALGFPAATETVDVVVPAVGILSLADSIDVSDPADDFIVQIGVPDAGATSIATPQRAGSGTALDLTVSTSDPGIGLLQTLSETNGVILLQIAAGESQTQGTVAAGGIAFVPAGAGSVTVTPSITGFTSLSQIVQVTGSAVGVEPRGTFPLSLAQNAPNPVASRTAIRFTLPAEGPVALEVFDISGRRVRTLVDRRMPAGEFEVRWNGADDRGTRVGAGVYFYRLEADRRVLTRRMVLLK